MDVGHLSDVNWSKTLMAFPLSVDIGNIENGFLWLCLKGNVSIGKVILRFLTITHPILQKSVECNMCFD